MPTIVSGRGVLVRPRQVVEIQATASGRLLSLDVRAGDVVKHGDRLGTIDHAGMRQQLREAQSQLRELLAQDQTKRALQTQHVSLNAQQYQMEQRAIELERLDLRKRLSDAQRKAPVLQQRVASRKRLEQLGLASRLSEARLQAEQAYQENQNTIAALRTQLQQLAGRLKQLESQEKRTVFEALEDATERQNAIREVQSRIAVYEGELERNSQMISKYNGRILEVTVQEGQMIETGMRLASLAIENFDMPLVGLTYFSIKAGKQIAPGMTIRIAPDTVARERFGSLLGTVRSVSAFPVTKAGMARLIGHADVVDTLLAQGPSIEVAADLIPSASSKSQYQWSSSRGPALPITSGTTTAGHVVVEQRAPITYVLPFLRTLSGMY